jgi:hypothetical protein
MEFSSFFQLVRQKGRTVKQYIKESCNVGNTKLIEIYIVVFVVIVTVPVVVVVLLIYTGG